MLRLEFSILIPESREFIRNSEFGITMGNSKSDCWKEGDGAERGISNVNFKEFDTDILQNMKVTWRILWLGGVVLQ